MVLSDDFRLCCFFSKATTMCPVQPEWPDNCDRLLEMKSVEITTLSQSLAIVILNSANLIFVCAKLKRSSDPRVKNIKENTKQSKAFQLTKIITSANDLFFGIYLSLLFGTSIHFGEFFVLRAPQWLSSHWCKVVGIMFLFLFLHSLFLANFVTLSKFVAVLYPFKTTLKRKHNILKCVRYEVGILLLLCMFFLLSFLLLEKQTLMHSKTCSIVGDTKTSVTVKCVTLLSVFLQICSLLLTIVQYFLMLKEIGKPKPLADTQLQPQKDVSSFVTKAALIILCNGVCWIPSAVLYLVSFALPQYPLQILTWNTVLITPLNSVLNPIVFILASQEKKKPSPKVAQQNVLVH